MNLTPKTVELMAMEYEASKKNRDISAERMLSKSLANINISQYILDKISELAQMGYCSCTFGVDEPISDKDYDGLEMLGYNIEFLYSHMGKPTYSVSWNKITKK